MRGDAKRKSIDGFRTCKHCWERKPEGEFYFGCGANRDFFSSYCNTCSALRARSRYISLTDRHTNVELSIPAEKFCAHCAQVKAAACFSICPSTLSGLSSYCRECRKTLRNTAAVRATERMARKNRKLNDPVMFSLRNMLISARKRAKEEDVTFSLVLGDLVPLATLRCPVLGIAINYQAIKTS